MKKLILIALVLGVTSTLAVATVTSPEQSRQQLIDFFKAKSPDIKFEDYKHGAYIYSEDKFSQWLAVQEFPPYLDAIDAGEALYNKDKAIYDKCFGDDVTKVRVKFPRFNDETNQVETLEGQINACRVNAGLEKFKWKRGDIAYLSAFYAYNARGQIINVQITSDAAEKAFLNGQDFFVRPIGQFELSCMECHTDNASKRVRTQLLSPLLGHTTHFPVFRAKWQNIGTLHRRFGGCNDNIRVKSFKAQSETYRNLEFFQAFMSNGLVIDGPGYRE